MLDDGCGNTLDIAAESNLGKKIKNIPTFLSYVVYNTPPFILTENCCPPSCLADNVDDEFKSRFIKAHQFDE